MRRVLALVLAGMTISLLGCAAAPAAAPQVRTFSHSPSQAADVALEHLDLLLLQHDVEGAYELMDEAARGRITVAALGQRIEQSPGFGEVTSVDAVEYQPVPGNAAIDIFLVGDAGETKYYYAIRLTGTMDEGYLVSQFAIDTVPFPATNMRQPLP